MDNNYVDNTNLYNYIDLYNRKIVMYTQQVKKIQDNIVRLEDLCVRLHSYDRSIVDLPDLLYDFSDNYVNQMYCWLFSGIEDVESFLLYLDTYISDLKSSIVEIQKIIMQLSEMSDSLDKHIKAINSVFSGSGSVGTINSNDSYSESSLQEQTLNSIQDNFKNNKELNQTFQDGVYREVYNEIMNLSEGKSHVSR